MSEIDVAIPVAGIMLTGSLVTPEGRGPFPTALLLAGSGPLDRDGNHEKVRLNLSADLAAHLAETGWASLRYDKRGVAASGGDYLSTGFYDELADAESALRWLSARPEVESLIVIGHSAGSLFAVELTGRDLGVSGAVLLATSAKSGEETLSWQTRQVAEHLVPGPLKALLRLFGTDPVKQQAKAVRRLKATTGDTARIQLVKVNAKWMREFIAYDPIPALRRASAPMKAITGSKDAQVDPDDLAIVAREASRATTLRIEDVDHLLRTETGSFSNPRKYPNQLKKPIDPRVIVEIDAFLGGFLSSGVDDGNS